MTRHVVLLVLLLGGCRERGASPLDAGASATLDAGVSRARLVSVGPRLFSNQTSTPLSVVGEGLTAGQTLSLGAPISVSLPLVVLDARHAYARLPGAFELGPMSDVVVEATVAGLEGSAKLHVINDTGFPDLGSLVGTDDRRALFVASTPTDTVFRIDTKTKKVDALSVDDGPSAMAVWSAGALTWLVVVHQFSAAVLLIDVDDPARRRVLAGVANASGVAVHDGSAFIVEQARDTVVTLDLASGRQTERRPVGLNPREVLHTGRSLVVGSLATGLIDVLSESSVSALEPKPGTPIVGGTTAPYAAQVMNGKAPRALAWSPARKLLFVSSIGPNIGPNADKMEVSMNGGVGVVDLERGWLRHLGFGAGITEGLALDDARGVLYAADIGLGVVRVLDVAKLAASDQSAATALMAELPVTPPEGFPLIRPKEDFSVRGRAGISLHTGPKALLLSADAKTLYVLERFTGALTLIDVRTPKKPVVTGRIPLVDTLAQKTRRLGQVLYFADLGRTAMSCDACHLEGHGEGVLFEKTMPLRIYRSPTVRGSLETPPYFTPASTRSMGETARVVGGRNRFHNPDPTPGEQEALTVYSSLIPNLPNPFVGADGAPAESLELPDGKTGNPRRGLALFEGKAECVSCHPPPVFTMDQEPATRGRFIDVGTPRFMPLRPEHQNTLFKGFGTPSLAGSWDVFPMLTTGLAGLEVRADGAVSVSTRFPSRVAVERWAPTHGRADLLNDEERNDLLAYLQSL